MSDFCNIFRGNLGQTTPEFHKILTDNKVFASMGLSAFTSGTLFETLKDNNRFQSPMGSTQAQVYKSIMGVNWINGFEPSHMYWDDVRKQYFHKRLVDYEGGTLYPAAGDLTSPTNIETFINYNNELVRGEYKDKELISPIDKIIASLDDCKTSMSGCLSWKVPLLFNFTPQAPVGNGCVHRIDVPFKLYFFDKDYLPDNKRHVVNKGAPRFAAVPTLAFGKPYSPVATAQNGNVAGDFAPPEEGGLENPRNTVNAELDIQFNANTGKWESGTKQMLARLLTNMDGIALSRLDPTQIHVYTKDDFQNPDKDTNASDHTVGKAVPMQVHNGNPNLFGPVWSNNKCEKNTKEIIKVVNRSKKSFRAGDIVMISFIGTEWIVQDLGEDPVGQRRVGFGKWGFTYLVSNSDSYFFDDRHRAMWGDNYTHLNGIDITGVMSPLGGSNQYYKPGFTKVKQEIKPSDYEGHFEKQYYWDYYSREAIRRDYNGFPLNSSPDISAMNLGYNDLFHLFNAINSGIFDPPNFVGAKDGYYQVSSFDMLSSQWGGTNADGNLIGRTRPDMRPDATDVPENGEGGVALYPFWGAVFPDGYDRVKINELKTNNPSNWGRGINSSLFFQVDQDGTLPLNDISLDRNSFGGIFSYFDENNNRQEFVDQLGLQIPADVALNASPSGRYGLPMTDVRRIQALANVDSGPADGVDKTFNPSTEKTERVVDVADMSNTNLYENTLEYFQQLIYTSEGTFQEDLPNGGVTTTGGTAAGDVIRASGFGEQARHSWLGKLNTESTGKGRIAESFYDLKPQNQSHVMFIPMTAEYLGQYDPHMSSTKYPGGAAQRYLGKEIQPAQYPFFDASRKNFGAVPTPGVSNNVGFISHNAYVRNARINAFTYPDVLNAYINDSRAMRIPSLLSEYDFIAASLNPQFAANQSIVNTRPGFAYDLWTHNGATNYGHDGVWFMEPFHPVARNNSGAVGIVSARCNMTVNGNEIIFETQQQLGVSNYGSMTGGAQQRWGGDGDNVNSFGTTALHVRVFDGWPQDQTIYDPRYMAVMHFNEGHPNHPVTSSLTDVGEGRPAVLAKGGKYRRFVEEITWPRLDFRVPTYGARPSTDTTAADYSLDGSIIPTGVSIQNIDPVRPLSEWHINPIRRGVLLPRANGGFSYNRRTIGLDSTSIVTAVDAEGVPMNGKNFVPGDRLLISGGAGVGAVLRVKSVDSGGGVTGLEWDLDSKGQKLIGYNYTPDDFGDDTIDPVDYGKVSVTADTNDPTTTGTDLLLYITKGVTWDYHDKDKAPSERSSAAQRASLSNNNGNGNEDSGTSELTGRTKNGRVTGQFRTAVNVMEDHAIPTEVTPLGNFDIFLHFHNDPGHTFAEGQGGEVSPINPLQQFIELTISTA